MIKQAFIDGSWLAYTFAVLMGLSILIYSILDGYDLGVGMLTDNANAHEKDRMIASIGPFWDANETWLILGVGLLLAAFPVAHGIVLTQLYLPVAIMIFGLIFRGVAFDFRAKAPYQQKWRWNGRFFYGSLLTSLAQGYMLGSYIIGFDHSLEGIMFSCLIGVSLASAYCLIGACWLIMKCEGSLQEKAFQWAKYHLMNALIGLISVSATTPLMSERIFSRWFTFPEIILLSIIPLLTGLVILGLYLSLKNESVTKAKYCWLPFTLTILVFCLSFTGLAYSFFPYIVPEKMTILEAAASQEALTVMMIGVGIVFPMLLGYTALSYYIFRGKASELRYD